MSALPPTRCLAVQFRYDTPEQFDPPGLRYGGGIALWLGEDLQIHSVAFVAEAKPAFQIVELPGLEITRFDGVGFDSKLKP